MSDAPITIQADGRIRLLAAVLALTTWPFQEQDQQQHDIHPHAKATRDYLLPAENHPAVTAMQNLMEAGHALDAIFSYSACLEWPALDVRAEAVPEWASKDWATHLRDFMEASRLSSLWERDAAAWEDARQQATRALSTGQPVEFLTRFFGPLEVKPVFQPNLAFPTGRALGFRRGDEIVCVCPPRIAYGFNPPWPYDDDPAATYADALATYARVLLREYLDRHPERAEAARQDKLPVPNAFRARFPDWFDQFAVLFTNGLTALFLEETFGEREAKSFVVMVQKAHGFDVMPSVLGVLKRYLDGQAVGRFGQFADYLSVFSRTLSVAEKLRGM